MNPRNYTSFDVAYAKHMAGDKKQTSKTPLPILRQGSLASDTEFSDHGDSDPEILGAPMNLYSLDIPMSLDEMGNFSLEVKSMLLPLKTGLAPLSFAEDDESYTHIEHCTSGGSGDEEKPPWEMGNRSTRAISIQLGDYLVGEDGIQESRHGSRAASITTRRSKAESILATPSNEQVLPEDPETPYSIKCQDFIPFGKPIGRGNSGTVTKAYNISNHTVYALKSISSHRKADRDQMAHELNIFHSSTCEFLVSFGGAFYDNAHLSFVLEYMNRGSLQDVIQTVGAVDLNIVRRVSSQILRGLHHMHELNQVHRDIKPANILLNRKGKSKITDFGIARILEDNQDANTFVGTRIYMSPERIQSQAYAQPSDIWSFGLTMHTLATGSFPYNSGVFKGFIYLYSAITSDPVPLPDPSVFPPQFIDFLDKCLQKEPEDRWTASQLLEHDFLKEVDCLSPLRWPWDDNYERDIDDLIGIAEVLGTHHFSKSNQYAKSPENDAIFTSIATSLGLPFSKVRSVIVSNLPISCPSAHSMNLPGSVSVTSGVADTAKFLRDPFEFLHSRYVVLGSPTLFQSHLIGNPTAVVCSFDAMMECLKKTHRDGMSNWSGYHSLLYKTFGDTVLSSDEPEHLDMLSRLLNSSLNDPCVLTGFLDKASALLRDEFEILEEKIKSNTKPTELELYTFFKTVFSEVLVYLFLGFSPHSRDSESYCELGVVAFRGAASIPLHLGFIFKTTFSKGVDAVNKMKLRVREVLILSMAKYSACGLNLCGIIARTLCDLKDCKETASCLDFVVNQLVLLTSGIASKAFSSLFCSLIQELSEAPSIHKDMFNTMLDADDITLQDLEGNLTIKHILQETERLHPPVIGGCRGASKALCFDGYIIPRGYRVWYMSAIANRDASKFSSPDDFQPCRWAKLNQEFKGSDELHLSFGMGERNCTGKRFSEMLISLTLVKFISRFAIEEKAVEEYKYVPVKRAVDNHLRTIHLKI